MAFEYKIIPITKNEVDSRIDRVIHKLYPHLNQATIEKSLRSKFILVNKRKEKSNYRLKEGDFLEVAAFFSNSDEAQKKQTRKEIGKTEIKLITDNIIYRDADLIVINKPSGLAVQGGSKISISVDQIMPYMLDTLDLWEKPVHKLVHRLDKETSGILLIALNNHTAKELSKAFKEKRVEKKYLAILTGKIANNKGQISSFIDKEKSYPEDDNAFTNYKVLAKSKNHTLLEFMPITGKTHQLRLHALELGFPILGDLKYDFSLKEEKNPPKLHLHAVEVCIPYQNSYLKLQADLPEYYRDSVKKIFGQVKI